MITAPIGTALGPPGVTEIIGGGEAVPDIIRIGDVLKKKRKAMQDPMNDSCFEKYEDAKQTHGPRFDPK
jgi:hypothetical protein